jgi:spore maturation protein CgeB
MKALSDSTLVYLYVPSYGSGYHPYTFQGIPDAAEAAGARIVRLDATAVTPESLRKAIEQNRADLVVGFIQLPNVIVRVGQVLAERMPVPVVNWFQEDPNAVYSSSGSSVAVTDLQRAARAFDMWFTLDKRMLPFWGPHAVFLPPAFDEKLFRGECLGKRYDVSFVGQLGHDLSTAMYWPYMQELERVGKKAMVCIERPLGIPLLPSPLERILRTRRFGMRRFLQSLPIWRCSWVNPADEREKARIIGESRIHFGISRVRGLWEEGLKRSIPEYPLSDDGLFYQVKGRLFQGAGAGAMVLTDYYPELDEMFDVGREVVAFRFGDTNELREKLTWFLSHDSERERIAHAGLARAHREHTFSARIQQILAHVSRSCA